MLDAAGRIQDLAKSLRMARAASAALMRLESPSCNGEWGHDRRQEDVLAAGPLLSRCQFGARGSESPIPSVTTMIIEALSDYVQEALLDVESAMLRPRQRMQQESRTGLSLWSPGTLTEPTLDLHASIMQPLVRVSETLQCCSAVIGCFSAGCGSCLASRWNDIDDELTLLALGYATTIGLSWATAWPPPSPPPKVPEWVPTFLRPLFSKALAWHPHRLLEHMGAVFDAMEGALVPALAAVGVLIATAATAAKSPLPPALAGIAAQAASDAVALFAESLTGRWWGSCAGGPFLGRPGNTITCAAWGDELDAASQNIQSYLSQGRAPDSDYLCGCERCGQGDPLRGDFSLDPPTGDVFGATSSLPGGAHCAAFPWRAPLPACRGSTSDSEISSAPSPAGPASPHHCRPESPPSAADLATAAMWPHMPLEGADARRYSAVARARGRCAEVERLARPAVTSGHLDSGHVFAVRAFAAAVTGRAAARLARPWPPLQLLPPALRALPVPAEAPPAPEVTPGGDGATVYRAPTRYPTMRPLLQLLGVDVDAAAPGSWALQRCGGPSTAAERDPSGMEPAGVVLTLEALARPWRLHLLRFPRQVSVPRRRPQPAASTGVAAMTPEPEEAPRADCRPDNGPSDAIQRESHCRRWAGLERQLPLAVAVLARSGQRLRRQWRARWMAVHGLAAMQWRDFVVSAAGDGLLGEPPSAPSSAEGAGAEAAASVRGPGDALSALFKALSHGEVTAAASIVWAAGTAAAAGLGLLPPMEPLPMHSRRLACDDALAAAPEKDVGPRSSVERAAQCVVAAALGGTPTAAAAAHLLSRGMLPCSLVQGAFQTAVRIAQSAGSRRASQGWRDQFVDLRERQVQVAVTEAAQEALQNARDGVAGLPGPF